MKQYSHVHNSTRSVDDCLNGYLANLESDVAQLLKRAEGAIYAPLDDPNEIAAVIGVLHQIWKFGWLATRVCNGWVSAFSRREQTVELASLFDWITGKAKPASVQSEEIPFHA